MNSHQTDSPASQPVSTELKAHAESILADLGLALRAVLAKIVPGAEAAPRDLERELGLHKTLGWRVLKVAYAREPLAIAAQVPGDEGLEKFLDAAKRKGVPVSTLTPVRDAASKYRDLVRSQAGDRASLEVMLMSLATPTETAVELKAARRAAYRSTSYTWGVQTAARVLAGIITPVGGDQVDLATLRAHVRMRRVRKDGILRLSRTIEHDTDAPDRRRAAAMAIQPEHIFNGVPLLPDFCTKPFPPVHAKKLPNDNIEYQFSEQPVGEQAAFTILTGEIRRGLSGARWRSETNKTNALMMTVRDPLGVGVIDLWSPPEFGIEHRALLVSAVSVDPLTQKPEQWHVLPASASIERMGRGLLAARLKDCPDYEAALDQCFGRLGWDPGQYELHRVRLEYPVLGSCLVLQTFLPERPVSFDSPSDEPLRQ
ncbi:MAG: hypothetical protein K2X32_15485 [Phycisphaerales bacterium]|nr:hypothetical protein [Phycisphaerales bacterium]